MHPLIPSCVEKIAYSDSLVSSLMLPAFSQSMDSFEQLLRSTDHLFTVEPDSLYHMTIMNSNESLFKALRQRIFDQGLEESLVESTVETVLTRKEVVYIYDQEFTKHQINIRYTSKSGKNRTIHKLKFTRKMTRALCSLCAV